MLPLRFAALMMHVTASVVAFRCSQDAVVDEDESSELNVQPNSIAARYRAINEQFVFDRPCQCEEDWRRVFCERLHNYEHLAAKDAPTICACRQFNGAQGKCRQFLMRCFWRGSRALHAKSVAANQRRPARVTNKCSCCFNQPDQHCDQLECENMKPKFDASVNATCLCFRRLNYPSWLCTQPALSDAVAPNGSQRAVTTVGDTAASKAAMANDDDRSSTSAESDDEAAAAAAAATAQQIWPFFEPVVFLETTHDNDEFAYDAATVFEPDATIRRGFRSGGGGNNAAAAAAVAAAAAAKTRSWLKEGLFIVPTLLGIIMIFLSLVGITFCILVYAKSHPKSAAAAAPSNKRRSRAVKAANKGGGGGGGSSTYARFMPYQSRGSHFALASPGTPPPPSPSALATFQTEFRSPPHASSIELYRDEHYDGESVVV